MAINIINLQQSNSFSGWTRNKRALTSGEGCSKTRRNVRPEPETNLITNIQIHVQLFAAIALRSHDQVPWPWHGTAEEFNMRLILFSSHKATPLSVTEAWRLNVHRQLRWLTRETRIMSLQSPDWATTCAETGTETKFCESHLVKKHAFPHVFTSFPWTDYFELFMRIKRVLSSRMPVSTALIPTMVHVMDMAIVCPSTSGPWRQKLLSSNFFQSNGFARLNMAQHQQPSKSWQWKKNANVMCKARLPKEECPSACFRSSWNVLP